MNEFDSLLPRMRDQLTEDLMRPGNFYGQARHAKEAIVAASAKNDTRAERSASAVYGGVVKRWRSWLIEQITDAALAGCDTSRDRVREWQRSVFGQSVSSAELKRYAKPERSGGGRSLPLAMDDVTKQEAAAFYQRHKNDVKTV